ncbi:MAG: HIT domain-containing protein [Deltaproteobacteria bacterium]|nr:HIT domain-containing protein [Deltaproteobacteria bacterium]
MERIWAPWRMEFILSSKKTEGCIFCKDLEPPKGLLIYKDSLSGVLLNKYPYNNGHLLVFPARHTGQIEDLSDEESRGIFSLIQRCILILKQELKPDGFNIGLNLGKAAGAGIEDHLHFHIVPRWNGDNNFMPVIAETKVMPEHLNLTYNKLKPYFNRL